MYTDITSLGSGLRIVASREVVRGGEKVAQD